MSINVSNQSNSGNINSSYGGVITPVLALAAVGVVINFAALAYLVYSPKIRRPLKVTLLNLVVSDCMFMSGVIIRTILQWNNAMLMSVCPVLTIMILVPSPISYSAVLGLAGYNFIAVYKATQYSVILTTQKALIVTAVSWTIILLIAILGIILRGREDPSCSLLAQVPPFILVLLAVHCLLCSFGMVVLNIAVAIKLRASRSVGSSNSKARSVQVVTFTGDTFYAKYSSQLPHLLSVPRPLSRNDEITADVLKSSGNAAPIRSTELYSERLQHSIDGYSNDNKSNRFKSVQAIPSTPLSGIAVRSDQDTSQVYPDCVQRRNCEPQSASREVNVINTSLPFKQATDIAVSQTSGNETAVEPQNRAPTINTASEIQGSTVVFDDTASGVQGSTVVVDDTSSGIQESTVVFQQYKEAPRNTTSGSQDLSQGRLFATNESKSQFSPRSSIEKGGDNKIESNHQEVKGRQIVPVVSSMTRKIKTVITLTILAFFNAVVTLPILGMWLWMAAVPDVRSEASYEWVSNSLSLLVMLNAVSNPFLYAWRFVDWGRLYNRCCKRGRTGFLTIGNLNQDSRQQSKIG